MPLVTETNTIDLRSRLPIHSTDVDVRLDLREVNGNKLTMISPRDGACVRMATGMTLSLRDGKKITGSGQIAITGTKLLGLFTEGSDGSQALNEATGSFSIFSFAHTDVSSHTTRTNWRSKPVEAVFESRANRDAAFILQVYSVVALMYSDGRITPSSLANFLYWFDPHHLAEIDA